MIPDYKHSCEKLSLHINNIYCRTARNFWEGHKKFANCVFCKHEYERRKGYDSLEVKCNTCKFSLQFSEQRYGYYNDTYDDDYGYYSSPARVRLDYINYKNLRLYANREGICCRGFVRKRIQDLAAQREIVQLGAPSKPTPAISSTIVHQGSQPFDLQTVLNRASMQAHLHPQ